MDTSIVFLFVVSDAGVYQHVGEAAGGEDILGVCVYLYDFAQKGIKRAEGSKASKSLGKKKNGRRPGIFFGFCLGLRAVQG